MKLFLTGSTGYIGNALLRALIEQGHEINVLIRNTGNKHLVTLPGVKVFQGDILDKNVLHTAMKGCSRVYHLAGFTKQLSSGSDSFLSVNVTGTHNVLSVAAENNILRVVYTSSAGVLGNSLNTPLTESDPRINSFSNESELSKDLAEEVVRNFASDGLDVVIVNPSRVYGPGLLRQSNAISRLLLQFVNGHFSWAPGCRNITANYVYIDDIVNGHQLAMQYGKSGERYILGGENASYEVLYRIIEEITGKKVDYRIPVWLMQGAGYLQLLFYHLTGKEPEFTPGILNRLFRNAALSSEKAKRELGYQITPLKTGLERTIESFKIQSYA